MMQPRRTLYMLTLVCVLIGTMNTGLFGDTRLMRAGAADDPVKQIENKFSSVQRRTATDPAQAEKDLIEARDLLNQLRESSPDNAKLPALQKRSDDLGEKLEKRLGRPIG
ncbi:MAG: hypothetical protein ABIK28_18625, partial [Planctomycetota bacterium]